MFQAAKSLRNLGILEYLFDNKKASVETVADALKLSVYGAKVSTLASFFEQELINVIFLA
jgi:hypothetical protein